MIILLPTIVFNNFKLDIATLKQIHKTSRVFISLDTLLNKVYSFNNASPLFLFFFFKALQSNLYFSNLGWELPEE